MEQCATELRYKARTFARPDGASALMGEWRTRLQNIMTRMQAVIELESASVYGQIGSQRGCFQARVATDDSHDAPPGRR